MDDIREVSRRLCEALGGTDLAPSPGVVCGVFFAGELTDAERALIESAMLAALGLAPPDEA